MKPKVISIDGVNYVKECANKLAEDLDGMKYCVIRTFSAGVHIGYVKEFGVKYPQSAVLIKSRRLHSWSKANSLSQVAMDGVDPSSRIAMELPEISLTDVIEVIPCSVKSAEFFKGVKAWKK